MTEPYDLRSNIKGKPGSQGTLFQVKDKGLLNPAQRWPKGYTPERQEAVRTALSDTDIHGNSGLSPTQMQRLDKPEMTKDGGFQYVRYPHTEARVTSAIAASTVPVEHLSGIRRIHDQPSEGHKASYWPGSQEIAAKINRRDGGEELIHEVGHHASYQHTLEGREAADRIGAAVPRPGSTEQTDSLMKMHNVGRVRVGVEEAVADNYALEHHRGPGRKPTPTPAQGLYERVRTTDKLDKDFPGYTDVRPATKHLGPQWNQGELF